MSINEGLNIIDMKILHFIYGLHVGGAETFLINTIGHLNSNKYKIDFALQDQHLTNGYLKNYISEHNSLVYILPKFPTHLVGQYLALKKIIKCEGYDYVHIHMNAAVNPIPLLFARRTNQRTIFIIHSHSTSNSSGKLGKFLHCINSKFLINSCSIHVACSELAGRWIFGNSDFIQIDNAVNITQYKFNQINRNKIRAEFGISPKTKVIGHIGRFVRAKNHVFMINCFNHYVKTHPDSILMLVGNGELYEEIQKLVVDRGISDKVIFTGLRTDIPLLLSAMDCFLFPSHFEGLGFVAIEAESSGLHVVASNNIPKVINLDNYVSFLPLSSSLENWAAEIDKAIYKTERSNRVMNPVINTQFDLNKMITAIINLYK